MPDDVALARADGFAHPDFASALRDRHQHDVHHAHAADQQPDGADHRNQNRHRSGDLPELVRHLLGAGDVEIIGLVEGNVAAAAQQSADLVFGRRLFARIHKRADEMFVVLRVVLVITAVGNQNVFVRLRVAEELALVPLHFPDYLKGRSVHENCFPHRVVSGKQRFGQVVPDDRDIHVMGVFRLVEEPAARDAQRIHLLRRGERAAELNPGDFLVAVAGDADERLPHKPRENVHGHGAHRRAGFFDGQGVFQAERLAHAFFLRQLPCEALLDLENPERIGAEIAEEPADVAVQAHQNGSDQDERGHSDHHPQHRQQRAELVLPQRVQRHQRVLAQAET